MDYCKFVNVFHGCSTVELPEPYGVAATWHFIKAITGNTTPAATLPFGKYSCCTYTAAYPTGYGDHWPNSAPDNLRTLREGARFYGLSHFHQSGTGAIDYYYNYAVTTPFFGDKPSKTGCKILNENACPGYYSVLSEGDILSEATVSRRSVYHWFTFPAEGGKIAVDFTNCGLLNLWENHFSRPDYGTVKLTESGAVAMVSFNGLPQFFSFSFSGARVVGLVKNNVLIEDTDVSFGTTDDSYGVLLEATEKAVDSRLTVSLKSAVQTAQNSSVDEGGFDSVRANAYEMWNAYLGRIEIETDDEREREIFYSNLYHSLVKPSDRSGECALWDENSLMLDFSTMWDIYKTQLPLIFTLYPEVGEKIVKTIFNFGKYLGVLPHTAVLKKSFAEPQKQACMLAELTVCDAYYRSIKANYTFELSTLMSDIMREDYAPLHFGPLPDRLTHLLDAVQACEAVATLCRALERNDFAVRLERTSGRMAECYDTSTGLLREGHDYYEGTLWNYSFRLHADMKTRVALAGGSERFTELLDRFFGYTDPESITTRFEGYNNEPDMETPYAYHFVGRHDRISEIVTAGTDCMFTTGRGGLPGNNDSGGLSSCYIWNVSGVFPVTGQNLMIIGTPRFKKTVFHLPQGKNFEIVRQGEGIYVTSAQLDNEPLPELSLTVTRMMCGGTLTLQMAEKP